MIFLQVFCTDTDGLLMTVLSERASDPANTPVHCGFDSGQGILKITFTATSMTSAAGSAGRSKYSEVKNIY